MRLRVRTLRRVVKGDLAIEFVPQRLTSYGGLELVGRYFRKLDVVARLRRARAALPSDYGSARLALLLLGLFYVGARRLEHLQYLVGAPLIGRFCGLARLPTGRTVSNWLTVNSSRRRRSRPSWNSITISSLRPWPPAAFPG